MLRCGNALTDADDFSRPLPQTEKRPNASELARIRPVLEEDAGFAHARCIRLRKGVIETLSRFRKRPIAERVARRNRGRVIERLARSRPAVGPGEFATDEPRR